MNDLKKITINGVTYDVAPGSHLEDKNDPHGVTAEQVGARPNTWMPTAEQVGARPNTWMPTAEQVGARPNTWMPTASDVGAAPAGYGLGKTSPPTLADANVNTPAQFFRTTSNVENLGSGKTHNVGIVMPYAGDEVAQLWVRTLDGTGRVRRCYGGKWYEEWLNPPLAVGKEYTTIDKYEGKTVYCALVQLALPAVTTASPSTDLTVPHGMKVKTLVRASANLGGSQILPYISDNKSYSLKGIAADNAIFRVCNTTYDATTANVLMYYTKE